MKDRSADSLSMYFGAITGPENITKLVDRMIENSDNHRVLVAEDDRLEVVGTIHLAIINDHEVELGIMVSEAYRGMGISTVMMDYVLNWCRNRGFDSVTMFCLSYNSAVLHVVKKYGLEISKTLGNSEAKVMLPRANIFTLGRENLANQQSIIKQNVMSFKRMLNIPLNT
jgi:RimJ/RimL family protein N-acetyltransferase